jgi:hypothetical protein
VKFPSVEFDNGVSESEGNKSESENEVENTLSASRGGCTSTDRAIKLLATTFVSKRRLYKQVGQCNNTHHKI